MYGRVLDGAKTYFTCFKQKDWFLNVWVWSANTQEGPWYRHERTSQLLYWTSLGDYSVKISRKNEICKKITITKKCLWKSQTKFTSAPRSSTLYLKVSCMQCTVYSTYKVSPGLSTSAIILHCISTVYSLVMLLHYISTVLLPYISTVSTLSSTAILLQYISTVSTLSSTLLLHYISRFSSIYFTVILLHYISTVSTVSSTTILLHCSSTVSTLSIYFYNLYSILYAILLQYMYRV